MRKFYTGSKGGTTCLLFGDKHWQGVGDGVREGNLLPINSFDVSDSVGQQCADFGRYGERDRSPKLILLQQPRSEVLKSESRVPEEMPTSGWRLT